MLDRNGSSLVGTLANVAKNKKKKTIHPVFGCAADIVTTIFSWGVFDVRSGKQDLNSTRQMAT
jgi:hypothetical protein